MDFTDQAIYTLIAARLCGEFLTEEEERYLSTWLESPANQEQYAYYRSLYEARGRLSVRDRVRLPRDFAERRFRDSARAFQRPRRWFPRYAAVILPVLILSVVVWRSRENSDEKKEMLVAYDIAPGSSKAVLKRENGQQFVLTDSGMFIANGVPRLGSVAGTLVYRDTGEEEGESLVENEQLEVGRGGEYKIVLPDGSRVWLNSESTLLYPRRFAGEERRVHLSGEAYFEVQPDAGKPFIVTVGGCDVRVLGTTFNVAHYTGDRSIVTTLVSGSVEMDAGGENKRLQPGQQCVYDPGVRSMLLREVDVTRYISWTNGLFIFDGISIEELARQISRWYDVEVRFTDDDVRFASFTGAMERYKPVSYIIRLLNETNTVTCYLEDNRVLTFRAPR
ncbi:MAG: FecR domain-containing protein [Odoribacteraceae bacterium]|jgi:ferric-dicitrate binding protein FerR (iron transport regulator)|nr:FecR domain-containing protein [Odoribacteraceae bacterium]